MALDEYNKVELPALQQLQSLGWLYAAGAELSPEESDERESFKDVVLEKRLAECIKRINPWINADNLSKVVRDLTKIPYPNLIEANKAIWTRIHQCVSVMQDVGRGNQNQTVHIIDFENPENNEFLCTNQFKVEGAQNIFPDIILFVNGLPLAVIECKSPYITNPIEAGIEQLMRYANRRGASEAEGAEKLFHYNLMMITTHRDKAQFGTITSRIEDFLEWKDPYPLTIEQVGKPEISQAILIAGLLSKPNFLDIMQNFTVFEPVEGRTLKKIARYQQFRAVHKTIERIKTGKSGKDKSGVIWHTQGSGKSLTMVFLSIKMRRDPALRDYKMVFLTDRTQLDNQLTSTFNRIQGETIYHAKSVKELKALLAKDASDIVTAMVQKFQDRTSNFDFPVLNESEKIIVLADEAHRTQYGTLGAAMNKALPNAARIAFTGTPLLKSEKTTNTFGPYIDTYTIEQSVKDGATVQIIYEGREPLLRVTGDSLDSLFDEYFADCTDEKKAAIKKKYGTEKAVLEAPQRIRRVCMDIVKHYRQHIQPNGFKAMIVTSSRKAAIIYKEQLDALEAPQSAVIISGDHNDTERFRKYTDNKMQKQQIEDFKKPLGTGEGESELSILIVAEMLLTGFDAPIAQVMYVDRHLADHTLLQAIARVNRINKNKFSGYVVDYYGLSDYLTEALEMFSTEDVQGALIELQDEIAKLTNIHTRALKHFQGMDLDDLDACSLSLKDEVKRQEFQRDFRRFTKQLDIVLPDPAATPFLNDLKQLGKILISARNLYRDEQLDITGVGEKVRLLIEEHVRSIGIDPKILPVALLAPNYKEQLNQHKSPRARASEIEQAIRHHIKVHIDEDPEYYKKLSERLEDIIRQYEEKWEELAQQYEEKWEELVQRLLDFSDNIERDHKQQATDLGLSEKEQPFYNILIAKLGGEEEVHGSKARHVKEVIQSLVQMLDETTQIVDFFSKPNELRRVEREIKRVVIRRFDESLIPPITEQFMELIKVKYK